MDAGNSQASGSLSSSGPVKLIRFTDAACVSLVPATFTFNSSDSICRKPSGRMVLTLVYFATQVNSIIRLSACNSTCTDSGRLDGLFFSFAHKGALLPRCQLQSNVENTMCFHPRCFPNEACATSVSEQIL